MLPSPIYLSCATLHPRITERAWSMHSIKSAAWDLPKLLISGPRLLPMLIMDAVAAPYVQNLLKRLLLHPDTFLCGCGSGVFPWPGPLAI